MNENHILSEAAAYLNSRKPDAARKALEPILSQSPDHPLALYLTGGAFKLEGRHGDAIAYYERSLAGDERQPQVHNSLGDLLARMGRIEEAKAAFERATTLEPRYLEAWINCGRLYLRLGDSDAAERAFKEALSLREDVAAAHNGLGFVAQMRERPEEAAEHFKKVLHIKENYPHAHQQLGQAYYDMGEYKKAFDEWRKAAANSSPDPSLCRDLGKAAYQLGDDAQATGFFRKAVSLAPENPQYHHDLNQFLYMMGKDEEFLQSYIDVLSKDNLNAAILSGLAKLAVASGRPEKALNWLEAAIAQGSGDASVFDALGHLLAATGRLEESCAAHCKARELAPEDKGAAQNYSTALLRISQNKVALSEANRAVALDPSDQLSLGGRVTALQANNDPAWRKLVDYEKYVAKAFVDVPDGFSSRAAFNAALSKELLRLHSAEREPVDQSLRGGTQVELKRLARSNALIASLVASFTKAIKSFAVGLPNSADDPFLSRKPSEIEFAGIWSVRLQTGGRHVSHVHPEGWLSSCYYVSLPDVIDDNGDAGYIKFGEPPFECAFAREGVKTIKPEEGALVLFPSYFWHGTVPFHSEQPRLTVAFDVKPKA